MFNVQAYAKRGVSHEEANKPYEDYFLIRDLENHLISMMLDGVSTKEHSDDFVSFVAHHMLPGIIRHVEDLIGSYDQIKSVITYQIEEALEAFYTEYGDNIDVGATLMIAIVDKRRKRSGTVIHIGDGELWGVQRGSNVAQLISGGENTLDSSRATYSIANELGRDHLRVSRFHVSDHSGLLMGSDGAMLVFDDEQRFGDRQRLIKLLEAEEDFSLKRLESEYIRCCVRDDITLLYLCFDDSIRQDSMLTTGGTFSSDDYFNMIEGVNETSVCLKKRAVPKNDAFDGHEYDDRETQIKHTICRERVVGILKVAIVTLATIGIIVFGGYLGFKAYYTLSIHEHRIDNLEVEIQTLMDENNHKDADVDIEGVSTEVRD